MARSIKLKVCGMRDPINYGHIAALGPDFMGLIFFPGSPRYVGLVDPKDLPQIGPEVQRVGVFVNASELDVVVASKQWSFEWVQLHGDETVEYCRKIKSAGLKVIKVFNLGPGFDFDPLRPYEATVDYFLFDTKAKVRGGSGQKFDWSILEDYRLDVPFFLSGGIGLDELPMVEQVRNPQLYAVDVNSKFELSPGLKDIEKVEKLVKHLDG